MTTNEESPAAAPTSDRAAADKGQEIDYSVITPFRRAVEIAHLGGERAAAEVEDDHHHFRVEVAARKGRVQSIEGRAIRHPWTMCKLAARELDRLVGSPLTSRPGGVGDYANIREQCTHMFDLAGLAIAALARDERGLRRFDMTIIPLAADLWNAKLVRQDGWSLDWLVRLGEIAAPAALEGLSLKAPFATWAAERFDEREFEAAAMLRRAIFVGKFRHLHNLDARHDAGEARANIGGCFVLQPERAPLALRMKGASKSFPGSGRGPLSRR